MIPFGPLVIFELPIDQAGGEVNAIVAEMRHAAQRLVFHATSEREGAAVAAEHGDWMRRDAHARQAHRLETIAEELGRMAGELEERMKTDEAA